MRTYIEAFYSDNTPILGNLDGQSSLEVRDYRRTNIYKALTRGTFHKAPRVAYWRVVRGDHVLETITNPHHKT